jgi:ribonuclease HI
MGLNIEDTEKYVRTFSTDSRLRCKIITLLEELENGATLMEAAGKASLSKQELDRILGSITALLKKNRPLDSWSETARAGGINEVSAYCDGASRGNPGEAACAVVILDEAGTEVLTRTRRLGFATNNVAEYNGVLLALETADELGAKKVRLRLDSELVVNQLNGRYKVKNANLKSLHDQAGVLLARFSTCSIEHISREENQEADKLANDALDRKV